MGIKMIITLVLVAGMLISYIGLKITGRVPKEKPENDKELKEKVEAYKMSMEESKELDDILTQNQYIYDEDEE